jgi:hypothetical protein
MPRPDDDLKLKPPMSSVVPKVKRSPPVTISNPTAAMTNPSRMLTADLAGDLPTRPTMALKVSIMTANISGGPKRRENSATMGAKNVSMTVAKTAPTKCEQKAAVSALPACPFLAMG